MNSDANPSTVPSRKRSRKARESTGKLTVREIVEKKDGYSWTTFLVQGWRTPDGRHGRKKFKSRVEAESFIALKSVEQVNSKTVLNSVVTRLSTAQVHEAEGAFSRLGSRYSLGQAVEYFLRHFAQPADPISLEKAIDAFLDDRRHEGTRVKFLVGMRNTINRFSAFATLRALPTDLQSQIEPTRLTIEAARAASLAEVISRIDIALRPTVRRVAERVARVHELLQQTLDSAVRDAIIAARDQIEKQRAPKDSCIAKAMLAAFPNAKIPDVHEITTEDVEAFLRSLRSRDGRTAVRKTWNTTRADLHSFFGWCASKQRRFCAENVASGTVKYKLARGVPHVLTVQQARELMAYVALYKDGVLAKYFALALFARLRTGGELIELARHSEVNKLLDLDRRVIHVQPEISKTGQYRQTTIRPVLLAWLTSFEGEIWPRNGDRILKHIRRRFNLAHDVLRHSFFSYLVSAEGSVERAALEGGNTEGIFRRHYLNLANSHESESFWRIFPPELTAGTLSSVKNGAPLRTAV